MLSVYDIATEIVAREGGFVNDPDDPGGATNYGVTIHTMRSLGLDLNHDGRVNSLDVKRLTQADAVDIFVTHYFRKPRLAELPPSLQPSVFDMTVNAGSNGIKILQRLIGRMGQPVSVDGVLGPQTLEAIARYHKRAPELTVDAYGIERRNYYYRIGDRRAASRKYARRRDGAKGGWIIRAEEFIRPRFHLTTDQHRARTAHWD